MANKANNWKKNGKTWLNVAKDLCNGLDNDVNDVAKRLRQYAKDNHLTMDEVEDMCWEDSTNMFNEIY